jgi:hypothetical protein
MTARAEVTPAGALPLHATLTLLFMLSIAETITPGRQKQLLVLQPSESQTSKKGSCAQLGSLTAPGDQSDSKSGYFLTR